jgi:hypothetical protein
MKIICSTGFEAEKTYSVKILISLIDVNEPEIVFKPNHEWYSLLLDNGKTINFKDIFFNNLNGSIFNATLPESKDVIFAENEYCSENNIPIIYGEDYIKKEKMELFCGLDIVASTFFMLSRWEEVINRIRDRFSRFIGTESLAYKAGFLDRPVVNEYAIMLANMILKNGGKLDAPKRTFKILPTHDVDQIFFYPGKLKFGYRFARGKYSFKDLYRYLTKYNPNWNFQRLMEISEKRGLQSRFYFISSSFTIRDKPNNYNHPMVQKLFKEIVARGHEIGLHGSFNSYENINLLEEEKNKLETATGLSVKRGRQHYLRFSALTTWKLWDDLRMIEDQTCAYHDVEGFRCGTGDSFPVFDLLSRKQLKLIETPLLIMEGTLKDYRSMEKNIAIEKGSKIIAKCRKYQSPCTLLYHNSSFYGLGWEGWDKVYEAILDS